MTISPNPNQVLQLIKSGRLSLFRQDGGHWFRLQGGSSELTGRLVIRPDWNEGPDDRPGLMPIIVSLKDEVVGYHEEGCDLAVEDLPSIYDALRERLSPSKIFRRQYGRWALI